MPDIVVVAPHHLERRRWKNILADAGYGVYEARTAVEGLMQMLEHQPDLIILAEDMPPLSASDVINVVRQISNTPIIVVGDGGEEVEIAYLELGADHYQKRPVEATHLAARCKALIRRRRLSSRSGAGEDDSLSRNDEHLEQAA